MKKENTGHDLIDLLLTSSLLTSLNSDVLVILRWENDRTMTKR